MTVESNCLEQVKTSKRNGTLRNENRKNFFPFKLSSREARKICKNEINQTSDEQ